MQGKSINPNKITGLNKNGYCSSDSSYEPSKESYLFRSDKIIYLQDPYVDDKEMSFLEKEDSNLKSQDKQFLKKSLSLNKDRV